MQNIVLTGFMGTGKTEVGKELSKMLGLGLVDVDEEIVRAEGMPISEIFGRKGEPHFRDIETRKIKEVSKRKNLIVSTGGGAILRKENMDALRENGIIVCLMASPETILKRTGNDDTRPLLHVPDPLGKIKKLIELRMPFYKQADIMVETEDKTPRQAAEEILKKVKEM